MNRVLETLPLDRIRTDGGTQPRATLDPATVQAYAEAMSRGEMFPPVIVFYDGTEHWLADGFHRLQAARDSSTHPDPDLDCEIHQGTQRDAVLFSAGANATHGLPRSNEDKRRAVVRLLSDTDWAAWSDRKIAEACKVSHPFVGSLRRELEERGEISPVTERAYTRDGEKRTMSTGNVSSRPEKSSDDSSDESPAPAPDDVPLPDLEPIILAALADGPQRLTQLLVRVRQQASGPGLLIGAALGTTLDRMVREGTLTRHYGQGTGKAIEYESNVVKTANGGNGAPSLDVLRDQIVGWLNRQATSQRPFWPAEIRKGALIDRKHESRFGQALAQLVEKGVLKRFDNGQYHFVEFERPVSAPARSVIAVMKGGPPARSWLLEDLVQATGLSLQGVKNELTAAMGYGAVTDALFDGYRLNTTAAKQAAAEAAQAEQAQSVDLIDPVTAEVTQAEPESDRPIDPAHMTRPLVARDEFGYLDQRPIRVVLNVNNELDAIEAALKAIDEAEFTLALARTPDYPTARRIKQADETALRVCGQIARLDVMCAQFAQQSSAHQADAEPSAEPVSDTSADPAQQPEAVD